MRTPHHSRGSGGRGSGGRGSGGRGSGGRGSCRAAAREGEAREGEAREGEAPAEPRRGRRWNHGSAGASPSLWKPSIDQLASKRVSMTLMIRKLRGASSLLPPIREDGDSSMNRPLRWGILGTGSIAGKFASQLPETQQGVLSRRRLTLRVDCRNICLALRRRGVLELRISAGPRRRRCGLRLPAQLDASSLDHCRLEGG